MSISTQLMDQLDNANVLFNVSEQTLMTGNGLQIPNKKVLINEMNGSVLGIVGQNYRAVTNEEIFDEFTRSIEKSNINTEGASINVKFQNGGAKTLVDFVFPNEIMEVQGDKTALSIAALNSFDGSTRYLTKAGGLRMKCLNGQILGKIAGSYSSLHNNNLDVEEGAKKVMEMVQQFQDSAEYFQHLIDRKLEGKVIDRVIGKFLNVDMTDEANLNKPRVNEIHRILDNYQREMGNTAYALYNTFTDYITHSNYKEESAARSLLRNRSKLETLMNEDEAFLVH